MVALRRRWLTVDHMRSLWHAEAGRGHRSSARRHTPRLLSWNARPPSVQPSLMIIMGGGSENGAACKLRGRHSPVRMAGFARRAGKVVATKYFEPLATKLFRAR